MYPITLHSHSKILTFLCMIPNPIRIFQKEFCFRVERAAAQSAVLPSDFNHNLSFGWKDWVKILNSSEFRIYKFLSKKKKLSNWKEKIFGHLTYKIYKNYEGLSTAVYRKHCQNEDLEQNLSLDPNIFRSYEWSWVHK